MKIKTSWIYLTAAAVIIIFLVITANMDQDKTAVRNTGILPNDETHQIPGNTGKAPSRDNVSANVKQKLELMKKDVDNNPDDTLKIREYADFLAAAHKPAEALDYYNKILKRDPKRVDILFSLSFIYYNQKDINQAETVTNQILALDKNNLQAVYNIGALAAGKGEKSKAKEIWEKLIKENPGSPVADLAKESLQRL